MRQIGVALLLYTNENQNKIPPRWVSGGMPWNDRLNEYFGIKKYPSGRYFENPVWLCPAAKIIDDSMFNRHYGMNAYVLNDRWALQRNAIPAPANIILIGEMNDNSDFVLPELNFTQEGDVKTRYRMSHKGGTGANYAFADGHVEFIIGRITDLNAATSPWKWW
ncbi:MAG: hypothetical protein CML13_02200 [Puniceicoccaceae bacterium]|nr:hypothetical protein [Puniceicoccaceae bacterium]